MEGETSDTTGPAWREGWVVPKFRTDVLAPRRSACCLVIPVINEGERIRDQLRRLRDARLGLDVIIADGGSTDGSVDPRFLRGLNVRALLTKTAPGKLSAQLRMAYAWALCEGYEGIVTVDGNGKDGLEAIPSFVAKLAHGYDYVQGSRYLTGGAAVNTPVMRWMAGRFIHAPLVSLASRHWFTDTTNGFRAYSNRYLLDPRVAPFRSGFDRYSLLFYLSVRASQLGYRVIEIPVRRSYPRKGAVPTKIAGVRGNGAVLAELLAVVAGKYHPRANSAGK